MTTFSFRAGCLILVAVGLVACVDGEGASGEAGVASAVAAFGSDFQMAFNQGRNDTPINVDLVTLTLDRTAEPFEF
ncbi:hypothetical protein [uncultured Roseobacter sp.]|uniref:hypothetical protein n=1 Tax=uncultured Roseobacter sp. TaxID=114847 RepID=UPI00261A3F68|nr:hypothetical protein [uncultured Roseobacter sp.]